MKFLSAFLYVTTWKSNLVTGLLYVVVPLLHSSPSFTCKATTNLSLRGWKLPHRLPQRNRCNGNASQLNESAEFSTDMNSNMDIKQYNTLPRLFVGALSNSIMPQLQSNNDNETALSLLKSNSIIQLSMEQTHYLSKVMRLFAKKKKGKNLPLIRIFDGINGEWLCQIIPPDNGNATGNGNDNDNANDNGNDNDNQKANQKANDANTHTKNLKKRRNQRDNGNIPLQAKCIQQLREQWTTTSQPSPWLFFAPIKKQRAKIMVEKCTELGAQLFCPILTEYTDAAAVQACIGNIGTSSNADAIMFQDVTSKAKKKSSGDAEKLSLVACEASEQCERLSVPSFVTERGLGEDPQSQSEGIMTLELLLQQWTASESLLGNDRVLLVCRERTEERTNVLSILDAMDKTATLGRNVAFLIGPEGGWSPQEEAWFDEYSNRHSEAVMGVSLGSNVLRAETASILAIGSVALWSSSKTNC